MVTRVRIEANGARAAEVEEQLLAVFRHICHTIDHQASTGEQVIERDQAESHGSHTAFSGRLIVYLNVASDSQQAAWMKARDVEVTPPSWTADDAEKVGGSIHV